MEFRYIVNIDMIRYTVKFWYGIIYRKIGTVSICIRQLIKILVYWKSRYGIDIDIFDIEFLVGCTVWQKINDIPYRYIPRSTHSSRSCQSSYSESYPNRSRRCLIHLLLEYAYGQNLFHAAITYMTFRASPILEEVWLLDSIRTKKDNDTNNIHHHSTKRARTKWSTGQLIDLSTLLQFKKDTDWFEVK